MSAADVARRIADRLDEDGIGYAIGGALALAVWGAPRNTVDVDMSVFVDLAELPRVVDALHRAGVIVDAGHAAADAARIGLFRGRLGRTPVDIFLSSHPHFEQISGRRRSVADPDGTARWFISAEDLAVVKLFYGRTKDVIDLERLFAVRQDLDVEYIRSWIDKMVPAGDRRLSVLDDLVERFTDPA